MLIFSLIVSAIVLLAVNLFACQAKYPLPRIIPLSIGVAVIFSGLCLIQLPPVLLQAVSLIVIALVWAKWHWRPRTFVQLSCAATLAVYGILGFIAFHRTRHLQEAFPYVSMQDRLPSPRVARSPVSLPPSAARHLTGLEDRIEKDDGYGWRQRWASSLRILHEDTVQVFVDQQGFGVARMPRVTALMLQSRMSQRPPIPQPGPPSPSPWGTELARTQPNSANAADGWYSLHENSVFDFINLDGFGFVKDRRHVVGFQEHQFSQLPETPMKWRIQRLDLVGLILHETPVVYLSEHLPRMAELRAAPTRSLDEFETAGLAALHKGEELFVRDRGKERRMLGAVRAVRQCLSCHDGERGELLGAFSYVLHAD